MRTLFAIALLLSTYCLQSAAAGPTQTQRYAVLPREQAKALLKQCSRETPENVDGDWALPAATVAQLEKDIPKLASMKTNGLRFAGNSIPNAPNYFRQYAGITIHGKRHIYINAISDLPTQSPSYDWRKTPVILCDGGTSSWGAVYDPTTRTFSQFTHNGFR